MVSKVNHPCSVYICGIYFKREQIRHCQALPERTQPGCAPAPRIPLRRRPRTGPPGARRRFARTGHCGLQRLVSGTGPPQLRAVPGGRPAATAESKTGTFSLNYSLDTNACVALINGKPAAVRSHFQKAISAGAEIYVSAVVLFELWYGVAKSSRPDFNEQRLQLFLSGPISLLSFEGEDMRFAGTVRAGLEMTGKRIGAYDVLIAGQALARELTLVTANVSEFSRVTGLKWQDWAKA